MAERRCKICGGPISAGNKTGFCMKSPVCTRAGRRANKVIRMEVEKREGKKKKAPGPKTRDDDQGWCSPWESPVSPLVAPEAIVRREYGNCVKSTNRQDAKAPSRQKEAGEEIDD